MKKVRKKLKLREWEDLEDQYNPDNYDHVGDSDCLVSWGLYLFVKKNMRKLKEEDGIDDYYFIYLGVIYFAIPKSFFIELDK